MDWTQYWPPPGWVVWTVGGICSVVVTWFTVRAALDGVRHAARSLRSLKRSTGKDAGGKPPELEDILTWVMAGIATAVSASGMWKFAGDVLELDGFWRALFFAFIEGAIVISALRARRSMREHYTAGLDGIAVWVLAGLTAVLASLDTASPGEVIFRLAAPLVAAWLWERGMRLERRKMRGLSGIHWRVTPERVLVRLGLAEARDRSASEVDAHRRLTRVALAAKRVHQLRAASSSDRKIRKAAMALDRRLDEAVAHTGLARDDRMKWALLDQVATLGGAQTLCDLLDTAVGPWAQTDHPLVTGAAKHHEAVQLTEAIREWTDALKTQHDPEARAAVASMAAYITGQPVSSVTPDVTSSVVTDLVTRRVTNDVTNPATPEAAPGPVNGPQAAPSVTPPVTPSVTTNAVTNPVTKPAPPEPDEQSKTQLMRDLWDSERAQKRYPTVQELADHAGAHHTLASRKRREWVNELPWYEQRKADPKKVTAS